ncbi:MAG TPA: TIM44-like domain-containing protein [Polyangium sp.]|nr:TIM44-like domain-containing protein [Polyangium sp.]
MKRRQFGMGLLATGLGIAGSLVSNESEARPGGGQTFRKNSSSNSGSSDSGSSFGSGSSNSGSSFGSGSSRSDNDSSESLLERMERERKEKEQEERKRKEKEQEDERWRKFMHPSSPSPSPSPSPRSYSSPSPPSSPASYSPSTGPIATSSSWSWNDPFDVAYSGLKIGIGCGFFACVGSIIIEARSKQQAQQTWTSSAPNKESRYAPLMGPPPPPPPKRDLYADEPKQNTNAHVALKGPMVQKALDRINAKDPNFSLIVFEDFLYALYTETQIARGKNALAQLEPYLGATLPQHTTPSDMREIRNVVVGSMQITRVDAWRHAEAWMQVDVVFEANYTEVFKGGKEQSFAVVDKWTLERDPDKPSRKPENATVLGCPNCGASLDKNIAARCGYCGEVCSPGKFDWTVTAVKTIENEARTPMLTGTTEEEGSDSPTVVALDVKHEFARLAKNDPEFGWTAFQARVSAIFHAFYQGWNLRDLACVRPYLSDNLMTTQRYWIETYKAQGLRNVCENPRVMAIHIAKVASDNVFDAITVRVYASCVDYTVNGNGDVVGGNRNKERQYSEYWTLIRAKNRRGAPREDPICPNCGAPNTKINMAGVCGNCNVHLTAGEFDWVLSRIQQDEVYEG